MTATALLEARLPGAPGVAVAVDRAGTAHGFRFDPAVDETLRAAVEDGALGTDGTGDSLTVFDQAVARLSALDAVRDRAGVNLLRFDTVGPVTLARGDGGPTLLEDVDLLKLGTFRGLVVGEGELRAYVDNYHGLRDAGVFLPPVRLDHGTSILGVIGYIDDVRLAAAVDPTTGAETIYLRGDLRITEPDAVGLIRRGTAVNRSVELGPYVTNDGTELSSVLYGVAFVDIPAVEGLAPIKLRAGFDLPDAATVTVLNAKDPAVSDEQTPAPAETETGDVDVSVEVDASAAPAETPDAEQSDEPAAEQDAPAEQDAEQTDEPAGDAEPDPAGAPTDEPAADATTDLAADLDARVSALVEQRLQTALSAALDSSDVVVALRADLAAARAATASTLLDRFTAAGVIVPATRDAATALLRHDDPAVRDAAVALLEHARPPVELGRTAGQTSTDSSASAGEAAGGAVIRLSMTADEVGETWSRLSTAQRRDPAIRAEREAWEAAHPDVF